MDYPDIEAVEGGDFMEKLQDCYDRYGRDETIVITRSNKRAMLGDNRNNSEDSRYANIGNVKKEYIVGKAWFIVSPLKDFGFVK